MDQAGIVLQHVAARCGSVPPGRAWRLKFKSLTKIQDRKKESLKTTGTSIGLLQPFIRKRSKGNNQYWLQGYRNVPTAMLWLTPAVHVGCMYSSWLHKLVTTWPICAQTNRITSKFDLDTGLGAAFTALPVWNVLWLDSEAAERARPRAGRRA